MSLASPKPLPIDYGKTGAIQPAPTPQKTFALGLTLAVAMSIIIAGTVFIGPGFAFLSIVPFVLAVIVTALRSPASGVCVYFAYSGIEGMYKYLSHFSQLTYVIKPSLVVVLLLFWLISSRITRVAHWKPPLTALIAIFAGWGLVMLASPTGSGIVDGIATLFVWYLLPISFYFICANAFKSTSQIETLLYTFIGVCTVMSAFAIIQQMMGQAWTLSHLPGYNEMTAHNFWSLNAAGQVDKSSWSPASTTSYSGAASNWSHLGALSSLGMLLSPKTRPQSKIPIAICLLINIIGMLISGVRLWVVVFIIEAIILFIMTARTRDEVKRNVAYLGVIAVLAGVGFAAAQTESGGVVSGRLGSTLADPTGKFEQDRGSNMTFLPTFMAQHPLGIGYQHGIDGGSGDVDAGGQTLNRETQFNSVAEDMGLPGLILLVSILLGAIWTGFLAFRRLVDPHLRVVGGMLFVLLIGTLVSSFAGPTLQGNDYFWMAAGLLAAMPMVQLREQAARKTALAEHPL